MYQQPALLVVSVTDGKFLDLLIPKSVMTHQFAIMPEISLK